MKTNGKLAVIGCINADRKPNQLRLATGVVRSDTSRLQRGIGKTATVRRKCPVQPATGCKHSSAKLFRSALSRGQQNNAPKALKMIK